MAVDFLFSLFHSINDSTSQKEQNMSTDRSTDNVLTTSEEQMTLGGRIFASRQNAGISLHMAASLLGVKHATLKSWENDRVSLV